ncbi:MAG: hypothetical protein HYY93_02110 [Planctomycetes bacterium]|nr:hypothetical protein [Planctomycetota bacterium]
MERLQTLWTRTIEHAGDTSRIEACLLVLGSIWILATIFRIRRSVIAPADTCRRLADLLQKGDVAGAVSFCRRDSSAVARVLRDFLPIAAHSQHVASDLDRVEAREMGHVLRARNPILWIAWLAILVGFCGGLCHLAYNLQLQEHSPTLLSAESSRARTTGLWQAIQHVTEGLLVAIFTLPWAWWLRDRAETVTAEARVFIRGVLASWRPPDGAPSGNGVLLESREAPDRPVDAVAAPPAPPPPTPASPPGAPPPITAAKA